MLSQVRSTNLLNHNLTSPIPTTTMNNQQLGSNFRERYFKTIGLKSTDESEEMQFRRKRSVTAPVPQIASPASNLDFPPEEVTKVKNPKRVTIVAPNSSPLKEHKDGYFFPFAMSVPANQSALLNATFSEGTSLLDQRSPSPMLFEEEDVDSDDEVDEDFQFTSSEAIPIGFASKMDPDEHITGRTRLGVPVITKGVDFEIQQKKKK